MLAAMHGSQMYAIAQLRMAADQAQARHDRMVSDAARVRRPRLLARVRPAAPLPAAAPVVAPPKPAS
jgi:hypothetical protein